LPQKDGRFRDDPPQKGKRDQTIGALMGAEEPTDPDMVDIGFHLFYAGFFKRFIESRYGLKAVIGTHPIPEKYYRIHTALGTWSDPVRNEILKPTLTDEKTRLAYN
jgi:hypothetical protein